MGTVQKSLFTTHKLPQDARVDVWRESISTLFDITPDRRKDPQQFHARVDSYLIDSQLILARCETAAQRFERGALKTARDGLDHYLIQTHLTGGQVMTRNGREIECKAGELMVIDLAECHDAVTSDFTQLTLAVPRQLLAPLLTEPDSQEGRVLSPRSSLTALAVNHLQNLFTVLGGLSSNEAPEVIEPTLMLIASALNGSSATVEGGANAVALSLLAQARIDIERNLHRNLTVDELCGILKMSRSTLYRLFAPLGGVRAYIQERRLRRSTQALLSGDGRPGKAGRRICDIAYAWGFVSEAHYSRAFRQHYGISPREARGCMTAPRLVQGSTASDMVGDKDYERWLVENLRL